MKLIKLETLKGADLYVSPERIEFIYGDTACCEVKIGTEKWGVKQRPSEVVKMIVDSGVETLSEVLARIESSLRGVAMKYAGDNPIFCQAAHVTPELDTAHMIWLCPNCGSSKFDDIKIAPDANVDCTLVHTLDEFKCSQCKTTFCSDAIGRGAVLLLRGESDD